MNPHDVRVGIVGLGSIGHSHAERLYERDATIAGGMDADPRANERFSAAYGVDTYDDVRELFAVADAVIVATPNCYHEAYAVAALDAGLCVLVEKPLAHSTESAGRIADAARWSEGFCMVGFTNRFAGSVAALKAAQQAGRFGEVRHVEANYIRRRGVPGLGSWFTDDRAAGGGSLIDIGVHALDLALYALDFPQVIEVTGVTRTTFGACDDATIETGDPRCGRRERGDTSGGVAYGVDDSVSAFIRCAGGATVSLEAAWATNRPDDDTVVVRGTDAGACFERENDTLTLYETATDGTGHVADTEIATKQTDALAAEQAAFLEAVARGTTPERNTLEQGLAVQRVIDAIYRSSAAGRAIRLAEPPDASTAAGRIVYPAKKAPSTLTDSSRRPSQPPQRAQADDAHSPAAETTADD